MDPLMGEELTIRKGLTIPSSRWFFKTSRAGGPGGQHVNTTQSRVELVFDIEACPELTVSQKRCLRERLATRCSAGGVLRLVTAADRSQKRNKEALLVRFRDLLVEALRPRKSRRPTRPTAASKRRRLDEKKRRSRLKSNRRQRDDDRS